MWATIPGSQSPLLVPIISPKSKDTYIYRISELIRDKYLPDKGEKPMLVSLEPPSPVTLAARLQPAPR